MALTGAEREKEFRQRMDKAGYKQKIVWVPKKSDEEAAKIDRRLFFRRIDALTAGWPKNKLSRFLSDVLKIVKEKIKEVD